MGISTLRYVLLLFVSVLLSGLHVMAQNPDLTITKTNSGNLRKSLSGSFTLTVLNQGAAKPDGNIVTVTDVLPTGLTPGTPTGNGWSITVIGNTITATRTDVLPANGIYPVINIPVTVASNAPNTITNTATVATANDTNPANNSASNVVDTRRLMDLQVVSINIPANACVNSAYTAVVTVRNNGPDSAVNGKFQFSVPTAVNTLTVTGRQIIAGGGSFGTGAVVNSIYIDSVTLVAGGVAVFTFNVLVTLPAPANLGIAEASLTRSGTDLDIDASNINNQVPGTPQQECDGPPSGGGCNNILRDTTLVGNGVQANAGPDQNLCENSGASLQGNNVTGIWTQASGPTTATINNPTSPNTNVNNLQYGTYAFVWTVTSGGCGKVSDTVLITNWQQPTPSRPGGDATVCGSSYTLQAQAPTAGTGVWTQSSGPNTATFANPANPNTTVSGLIAGAYVFVWTTSNGPVCPPNSQQVTIRVNAGPTQANAGPDQQLCNATSTTMAANSPGQNENGTWNQVTGPNQANILNRGSATTGIQGLTVGTYTFTWSIQGGNCPNTIDTVLITVQSGGTQANAGPDQTKYNTGVFTMSANNPPTGTGTWAVISGSAVITSTTDPNTQVTLQPNTTATLTWTINNGVCGNSVDTVVLKYLTSADLQITKTVLSGNFATGSTVQYSLLVVNLGSSDATGFTISDNVPAQLTNVTWTAATNGNNVSISPMSGTGNNISATANIPFATGNSITITVTGKVAATAIGGTVITNTATVTPNSSMPDPNLNNNTSTVTNTVPNNPPVAVDDNYTTYRDVAVSGNVTTNDYDPDGDALTVNTTPVSGPANGTVQLNANGTFTYTPAAGFTGTDKFVYTVCDTHGACVNANVYITVLPAVIDLDVKKTASPATVTAGGTLTYTITVTNKGVSTIHSNETFTVKDTLPTGFIFSSVTTSAGTLYVASGNWTGVTLAPGQSVTATITGTVSSGYTGTSITNKVTAIPPPGTTDSTLAMDSVTTPVTKAVEVVVTKSDFKTTYVPGTDNTYTITVKNQGPSDLVGATFTDLLPTGITAGSWTVTTVSAQPVVTTGTGSINQQFNLPAGGSAIISFTISIPSSYTGQLTNTASVSIPNGYTNINPDKNSATDIDDQSSTSAITVQKSGPVSANAGDPLSYTIVVTNAGPSDLINASIQDVLPPQLLSPSWTVTTAGSATAAPASGTGNVSLSANIPAGTANTVTILVSGIISPDASGSIVNFATVTPAGKTPVISNTVTTTITNKTGITILKAGPSSGHVIAGNAIGYDITVTNSGPSNSANLVIKDTVPANITNVTWRVTPIGLAGVASGAASSGSGNIVNTTVNIPAGTGNQVLIHIDGTVNPNASGTLSNTAYTFATDGSSKQANNQTLIDNSAQMAIVKAGPATVDAGSTITYTLQVTNNGPSNAMGAVITDQIPVSITNVTWTASAVGAAVVTSGASGTGNGILVNADIPVGTNNIVTVTITGTVAPDVTGVITNSGSVSGNNKTVNSNVVNTQVNVNARLAIVKTGPATAEAGSNISYGFSIYNYGPSDATNITLRDTLPIPLSGAVVKPTINGNAAVSNITVNGNIIIVTGSIKASAGNSITLNATATIDPSFAGQIQNTGYVTNDGINIYPSNVVTTTVASNPKLGIQKNGPDSVSAGQTINYTLLISNAGLSNAQNVKVNDVVPAAITNVKWTTSTVGSATVTSGATGTGNTISITGNIPGNRTNLITVLVSGTVNAAYTGTLQNFATVAADGVSTINSDTVNTVVVNSPNMVIHKSGPATVGAGDKVVYTIDVSNTGPSDALKVDISDILPKEMINSSYTVTTTGGATIFSRSLTAVQMLANIPAGTGHVIVTVNATADPSAAGTVVNVASETLNQQDSMKARVLTQILNQPVLVLDKTGPAQINAGQAISYTLIATNTSRSDAKAVTLQDVIPVAITNVTWTATVSGTATLSSGQTGTSNNLLITGDMPAGTGNHIFVNVNGIVKPDYTGSFTNFATIYPKDHDTTYSDTVQTIVTNSAALHVVKGGPDSVAAGGKVTYTLLVYNSGPSDARNINITDAVPVAIQNVTWTTGSSGAASIVSGSGTGNNVLVTGNIPAGVRNFLQITIMGTVDPSFTGVIPNIAQAIITGNPPVPSNQIQTVVYRKTGIGIAKNAPAKVNIGGNITYQLVVSNSGPSNATGISIADAVPADITNVSWTATTTGTAQVTSATSGTGNNISLTGNINAGTGNTIVVNVSGTVRADAAAGTLTNIATATPSGEQPVADTVNTQKIYSPGIQIQKTGPATINPGNAVTYTIVVGNAGPSDVTNLAITDPLDAGILNAQWTATTAGSATVSAASGAGNINLTGNIPAGNANHIMITVTGTLDPAFSAATLVNTATAQLTGMTPVVSTVTSTVTPAVALHLTKSGPATASPGEHITYTLTLNNNGPSNVTGLDFLDIVPASLTNVTWTATANGAGATVSAGSGTGNVSFLANLPAGSANIQIIVNATIDPATTAGTILNVATAAKPGSGITPATATFVTELMPVADLAIIKSGPATAVAGETITYTLRITNRGYANVIGAAISDQLPADFNIASATATSGGNASATAPVVNGQQVSTVANITAGIGNYILVTITGTVAPAATGTLTNTAIVTPPAGVTDDNLLNNSSTITTEISTKTGLGISKYGPATVSVGDTIHYQLVVGNNGPSDANGVSITDNVPAVIGSVQWTATATGNASVTPLNGTGNNIALTGNVGAAMSGVITVNITGVVLPAAGTTIVNSATATIGDDRTSTVTTAVDKTVNLRIKKTAPYTLGAGQPITYTISVTNDGPSDVTDAVIADALNAAVTNATWTAVGSGGASVGTASGTGNVNLLASIPANTGNVLVTVTGIVDPNFTGVLPNTATATLPAGASGTSPVSSTVNTIITGSDNLQINKAGPAVAIPGSTITYILAVTNPGPASASGITITDTIPTDITNVTWTSAAINGTVTANQTGTGNNINVQGNLSAAGVMRVVVVGTVNPSFTGTLLNTGYAKLGANTFNSNLVTTTVTAKAGINIQKTGPAKAIAGQPVNYNIVVGNAGPSDAPGTIVGDLIPAEIINPVWTATTTGTAVITSGAAVNKPGNVILAANIPAGSGNTVVVNVTGTIDPTFTGTITNVGQAGVPNQLRVTDTVNTVVTNYAGMQLMKTGPDTVSAGAVVAYSVILQNNGPSEGLGIHFMDTVPAQLSNVRWSAVAQGGSVIQGGDINNQTGNPDFVVNIPAGADNNILVTISGTVDPSFAGTISNHAAVVVNNVRVPSNTVNTVVVNKPGLHISKTGAANLMAGGKITYNLLVTNTGPSDAANVAVNDQLPAPVINATWVATANGNATIGGAKTLSGTGNVVLNASIPAGTGNNISVDVIGSLEPTFTGNISNTAIYTAGTSTDSSTVQSTITADEKVSIRKSGPDTLSAGSNITYTLVVQNTGLVSLNNLSVRDSVPANIQQVTWTATTNGGTITGGATGSGNLVIVNGTLPVGDTNSIIVTINGYVGPSATGSISNLCHVANGNNILARDHKVTAITNNPSVLLTKTGPATASSGGNITYLIDATNFGPSDLLSAVLTDNVPPQILNVTWTVTTYGRTVMTSPATNTGTGNHISIAGFLPAGDSNKVHIEVKGTIDPSFTGTLVNTATGVDDIGRSKTASVTTVVTNIPVLGISKTGPASVIAGDAVSYHIAVTNEGTSDIAGALITDAVPATLTNVTWTASTTGNAVVFGAATGSGNNVSLTGAIPLGTGNGINITVSGQVPSGTRATSITNSAAAKGADSVVVNSNVVTTTINQHPGLQVVKTGPALASAGDSITWIVTLTNNGPSDAYEATLTDNVPNNGITGYTWFAKATGNASLTRVGQGTNTPVNVSANIPVGTNNSVVLTISAKIGNTFSGTLSNSAVAAVNGLVTNSNVVNTLVSRVADVSIEKTGDLQLAELDSVTYLLIARNNGPAAADGAVVVDQLTAEIGGAVVSIASTTLGAGNITINNTGNLLRLTIGTFPAGSAVTFVVKGLVTTGTLLTNEAIIRVPDGVTDPYLLNNTSTMVNTFIVKRMRADLQLTKSVQAANPLHVGDKATYSIVVTNNGPLRAEDVQVSDTLKPNLELIGQPVVSGGNATYNPNTRIILWTKDSMATGTTQTITYTVRITNTGVAVNSALVTAMTPDPDFSNNYDVTTSIPITGDDIFIPNTISPNGDGKNDYFVIPGLDRYPNSTLLIYNRWGNMVYQSKNYDNTWNGKDLNEGTYFYILKLNTGTGERQYKGWIELVR
ncbi:gliding motility-associated C-terminal domain-containing protein [Chitinophaga sp. Cy-1792]|uniref:T9SS type B sorting domain-containing protein n=1 Tax=Chitinophaga sp. Cy-1792 TaxID=2608339 RepID=UPI00141DFDB9|nr:gliding motility-associated C-terminal domain-containing protein [Chitinophaga sp. Cy-1792]NIG51957.1 DUF11 domain-containing protein [Chitinophaga sp. Cy-1792]